MNEESKNTGTENETTGMCCNPEDIQKFFQKMAACCSGQGGTPDCRVMMESMKEKFCGKNIEKTKTVCGE